MSKPRVFIARPDKNGRMQLVEVKPPPLPRLTLRQLTRRALAEAERRRRYGPWKRAGEEAQP